MTGGMSAAQTGMLYGVSSAVTGLLGLAMSVAFMVGAFIVRRTRPDAFGPLVASSGIHMGNLIFGWTANMVLPAVMLKSGSGGMDGYAVTMVLVHGMTTTIGLVANALLLVGILRLAKGPQVGNPFAEGRYQ
jgi:hypothetical protein